MKINFIFIKNQLLLIKQKLKNRKIVLSKKDSYGNKGAFKLDIQVMMTLYHLHKLPQMNAFVKYFDKNNKCMNLLVPDEELLRKIQFNVG